MSIDARLNQFVELAFKNTAEFAHAMGVKPPSVYPYLKGHKRPGASMLERLADLGLDVHWLITGEGPMLAENEAGQELRTLLYGPDGVAKETPKTYTKKKRKGDDQPERTITVTLKFRGRHVTVEDVS
jgi:transcriptional regulator with XRE-family HTH domain